MLAVFNPLSWTYFWIIFSNIRLVDVHSKYLSDRLRQYKFEDFFWTGSADKFLEYDYLENDTNSVIDTTRDILLRTTTVFHTTTILYATVFPNSNLCSEECSPSVTPLWTESFTFSSAEEGFAGVSKSPITTVPFPNQGRVPTGTDAIYPTSVLNISKHHDTPLPPDQQYWLLTVLRVDIPGLIDTKAIENNLTALYRKAFSSSKRRDNRLDQIKVTVYNATKFQIGNENTLALIYSVANATENIPANKAAADMQLLRQSDIIAELGYPVVIIAEPYLRDVGMLGAQITGRSRDAWLLVGSIIAAVALLVGLAAILAIGLSKNRAGSSARGMVNRQQIFEGGEKGNVNLGYENNATDNNADKVAQGKSAGVKFSEHRPSTSSSDSSETSLVRLRQQKKREMQKVDDGAAPRPRPRTRLGRVEEPISSPKVPNKIDEVLLDETDNAGSADASSPPSYLSMPSVKAFPRGPKIPEPLNRVLEPVSIRDLDNDTPRTLSQSHDQQKKVLKRVTRHESLEDDPGVIGPVVWDRHCQQMLQLKRASADFGASGRMRKRFTELLDDAFSLFAWSRSVSPEEDLNSDYKRNVPDYRARSAVLNSNSDRGEKILRPKTTGQNRPDAIGLHRTRDAWDTPGFFSRGISSSSIFQAQPDSSRCVVDPKLILVEGELSPSDPAVPLIAAIKDELKKFRPGDNF